MRATLFTVLAFSVFAGLVSACGSGRTGPQIEQIPLTHGWTTKHESSIFGTARFGIRPDQNASQYVTAFAKAVHELGQEQQCAAEGKVDREQRSVTLSFSIGASPAKVLEASKLAQCVARQLPNNPALKEIPPGTEVQIQLLGPVVELQSEAGAGAAAGAS